MNREFLLKCVAPCSMLCCTCMAAKEGPMAECARRLTAYSEGICEFLGMDSSDEGRTFFGNFNDALHHLSGGNCSGCRGDISEKCGCIGGCVIPDCIKEHGVDFCADCGEFPCAKAKEFFDSVDTRITRVWEDGSRRIKEVGLESYYDEKKDVSHYLHYKK
ncbi:MAG: DUF3795 domain-containing protein [Clostridiales bacterium]|nr:DUF3795 domain-containing protein [Clostridiales bacterium]